MFRSPEDGRSALQAGAGLAEPRADPAPRRGGGRRARSGPRAFARNTLWGSVAEPASRVTSGAAAARSHRQHPTRVGAAACAAQTVHGPRRPRNRTRLCSAGRGLWTGRRASAGGTVVPSGRPPASWYLSPSQRERAHPRASQPEVRDAAARPPPGRAAPSPPQGPCPPSSSPVPSSPTVPCGSPAHLDLSGAPNAVAAGGHVWSTFGKPTGRSLSTARARGGGAATRVWAPVRPTPGRVTRHCHCPSRSADSDPPEGAQEAPAGRGEAAPRGPRRGGPHARRRRARRGGGRAVARARERSRREAQGAGGQLRRRPAR